MDLTEKLLTQSHDWIEMKITRVHMIEGVPFELDGEGDTAIGCDLCDISYSEGANLPCPGRPENGDLDDAPPMT